MKIIIPAREGSKRFPGKNRVLWPYTVNMIPDTFKSDVIVSTDDWVLIESAIDEGYDYHERDRAKCGDSSNPRDHLLDCIHYKNIPDDEIIIMLYLVYPGRTWDHVDNALYIFTRHFAKSLLCCQSAKTHPYLCVLKTGGYVCEHDISNSQDYPDVVCLSHYIFIAYASEIRKLSRNLYNSETHLLPIGDVANIDTMTDFEEFKNEGRLCS